MLGVAGDLTRGSVDVDTLLIAILVEHAFLTGWAFDLVATVEKAHAVHTSLTVCAHYTTAGIRCTGTFDAFFAGRTG